MVEPYPGTQVIYEHFGCTYETVTKVYPPNTTLILNNPCDVFTFTALGEITKLVVESNYGRLFLGSNRDEVYTKEVVVKNNDGWIYLNNSMDRVEVQTNSRYLYFYGKVAEHVDVKKANGQFNFRQLEE